MKIFFITAHFPKGNSVGGAEIQCVLLAKYLAKRGHQTFYLGLKEKINIEKEWSVKSCGLMKSGSTLKALMRFYKVLKREKPDICYIRSFDYLFVLNLVCKLARIKVVYNTTHINNCYPYLKNNFNLRAWLWHYLNFKTLSKVNLITINKFHAKLLKKKYNIDAKPIYNSMEDNYNDFSHKKKNNVVWVNNIKSRKNPEIFIEIAKKFKDSNWEFLMIGEIQGRGYLEKFEKAEKQNPRLKYLGPKTVREVDKILAESKIFLNTCEPEGFGNNFIQAWFSECSSITLKFDPDGIIKRERIGFHSKTFKQIIKDLNYLMNHNQERIEMGKRARKYTLKEHNINKNVLKYELYFKKIINIKKN